AARETQPFLQAVAVGIISRWREARVGLQVGDILQHGCALCEPLAVRKLEHRHRALGRYLAKVAVVLDQLLGPDIDEAVARFDTGFHQRNTARERTGHRAEIELQHDALRFDAPTRDGGFRAWSTAAGYLNPWLPLCRNFAAGGCNIAGRHSRC